MIRVKLFSGFTLVAQDISYFTVVKSIKIKIKLLVDADFTLLVYFQNQMHCTN